jgi:hypothetical protein
VRGTQRSLPCRAQTVFQTCARTCLRSAGSTRRGHGGSTRSTAFRPRGDTWWSRAFGNVRESEFDESNQPALLVFACDCERRDECKRLMHNHDRHCFQTAAGLKSWQEKHGQTYCYKPRRCLQPVVNSQGQAHGRTYSRTHCCSQPHRYCCQAVAGGSIPTYSDIIVGL